MGSPFIGGGTAGQGAGVKFTETRLSGAFVVEPELIKDDRGFFARSFCRQEFARLGLVGEFVQNNVSFNATKGTLRGLHYQSDPFPETKLVRCTMGRIFDAIVDIRPRSSGFGQWFGAELSADNRTALYIPVGFAHGFITLEDDCEMFYQMSEVFHPECARSLCWKDPEVGIAWPEYPSVISDKDAAAPKLQEIIG
jgi:dTDP-4-dehydrorhamnose 3,5-epimerase